MAPSALPLPSTPFTLTGGCFCKSIRYTISVPTLDARPLHKSPCKTPFGTQSEDADGPLQRWPIITFDHCTYCRHVAGSIVQPWFVCPLDWVTWTLLPKILNPSASHDGEGIKPATIEVLKPSDELRGKTYVSYFSSSEGVHRIFCGKCGTGLTFYSEGDEEFDVGLGTLDDESLEIPGMKPARHSWHGDGISWVKGLLADGEKAFST